MRSYGNLPIMPKANKAPMANVYHGPTAPYPPPSTTIVQQRPAAIWNAADDEILLQARASGLNWQPIAKNHFPNKTANACRKRHERLIERRHVEDWDAAKLEMLAEEYMAVRKEMWEVLASRLGERWGVVEAKCMEKGLKTLQSVARQAQRRATQQHYPDHERGISDHHSDSGIGLGSDAEMDVEAGPSRPSHATAAVPYLDQTHSRQQSSTSSFDRSYDHSRSNSLPQPLPLYQPPPPIGQHRRTFDGALVTTSPQDMVFNQHYPPNVQRCSPESQGQRSAVSLREILAP